MINIDKKLAWLAWAAISIFVICVGSIAIVNKKANKITVIECVHAWEKWMNPEFTGQNQWLQFRHCPACNLVQVSVVKVVEVEAK